MSILFSNPPWWEGKESRGFLRKKRWRRGVRAGSRWPFTYLGRCTPDNARAHDYIPYPFFLGYATTYAANKIGNDKVFFRDSIALSESYNSFYKYLDSIHNKIEYFLIESATPSWDHDYNLIKEIKKKYPNLKIVVAGPISTSDEKWDSDIIHAILKGEYEKNIIKVLEGQTGLINHDLLTKDEMNDAPIPYYDNMIYDKYFDGNPIPMNVLYPQAHIWSSRGCPFKCIFCVWPAAMTGNDPTGDGKRNVRQYTPDYIDNLLTELTGRYKFKAIYFDDDTFNIGNRHTENMSALMGKFNIPWFAMCRADTSKKETWKKMADNGCKGVKIGVESGSQVVVDKIVNKHLDLKYVSEIVSYIRSLDMSVHGTFTYGLPGETKEDMIQTKRFINSTKFSTVQESGTAEIEGTPLHTLINAEKLTTYPSAVADENYDRQKDGGKKWQSLVKDLQNN
tara:strand:- start:945 stop:2297 length:1353 start_codon:yes stop_codon:yes gene_type:complete